MLFRSIGKKYLRGAMGYGGPCFPRDNVAFSVLARGNKVPALLAEATDQVNKRQAPRLCEVFRSKIKAGGVAAVLGLSYKPNTPVIEESQGVRLAQVLADAGFKVVVYDPQAMPNAKRELKGDITYATSAADCLRQADAAAKANSGQAEIARIAINPISPNREGRFFCTQVLGAMNFPKSRVA